jgi:hypothetical protein
MQPTMMQERPPYVEFKRSTAERRYPVLDEEGKPHPQAGQLYYVDVDLVKITQIGGKDTVEKVVDDWLENCKVNVQAQRMPREWLMHYELTYEKFKLGQEVPIQGTPIRNWPLLTPAQVENCTSRGIRAVEDLAAANEQTLNALGMGSRALKQQAVDYLAMQKDSAPLVEQLNALRVQVEALGTRCQTLAAENQQMGSELAVLRGMRAQAVAPGNYVPQDPVTQLANRAGGDDFDDITIPGAE